jgi:hypothetical protein
MTITNGDPITSRLNLIFLGYLTTSVPYAKLCRYFRTSRRRRMKKQHKTALEVISLPGSVKIIDVDPSIAYDLEGWGMIKASNGCWIITSKGKKKLRELA